ncbi:glycosyltransferase family 4 protein [Coraliomargarita algicola]|uniref:Glycosyltransferase family 4 protein n=1 Tax=Coraliomargarita algicola TaxID=3092156 RepID=A0ABZ0RNN7_9BACT|nr:glycosyltransferase family 4 protein [Coraliomargarita sp. J2-16]WPJ97727.1 glycosyltransferase family 4 protein [Coraliomargarita sp. J2-16]
MGIDKQDLPYYLMPRPPQSAIDIQSGVDRYLFILLQAQACIYRPVDDCVMSPVIEPKLESVAEMPMPKLLPEMRQEKAAAGGVLATLKLIVGYTRQLLQLRKQLSELPNRSEGLIHVNRVGCEIQTIAARLAGFSTVVTTVHNLPGEDAPAQHWFRRCIEWLSFACGDRHICVSHATFDAWHQRVGLRRDQVEIIYNGMTPPDYSQFDRDQYRSKLLPAATDAVWIGICARLHPMKGHAVLLQAFARLLQGGEHPEVALVIAGSGGLDQELQQLAKDLEIEDSVYFLGHRTDAIEFAAAIDINVLPSIHSETLGYSLIEAMFAARPSVVSDVGGMKELVQNSGGGKVVKAYDVEALADALACYLSNPTQMVADGQKAQSYALEHLTADKMAAATMEAYAKLV